MINHCHGFILHKRAYRDTSLLVDVFTKEHGKLRAVAKGGRKKSLHLFTPFWLELNLRNELSSLFKAEAERAAILLSGKTLPVAYYLNELLTYLLYDYDPQPVLYEHYQNTLEFLATETHAQQVQACLRRFELLMLTEIGYEINFSEDAEDATPIIEGSNYRYYPGQGFVKSAQGYQGEHIKAMSNGDFESAEVLISAKSLLRQAINHLLEGRQLKSRELFI